MYRHIVLFLQWLTDLLTFADLSSMVLSMGSTTECSCTYVRVLVAPISWKIRSSTSQSFSYNTIKSKQQMISLLGPLELSRFDTNDIVCKISHAFRNHHLVLEFMAQLIYRYWSLLPKKRRPLVWHGEPEFLTFCLIIKFFPSLKSDLLPYQLMTPI